MNALHGSRPYRAIAIHATKILEHAVNIDAKHLEKIVNIILQMASQDIALNQMIYGVQQ